MKKLPIFATLAEGCRIGLVNFFSLLGVTILYLLTIWIPYLNVGTTIAVSSLPAELAKGKMINPAFIFDGKYRKNMGEFFILYSLMTGAVAVGLLFGLIPGIVISIAWTYAIVIFVDKDLNALESLRESNRITYGNKWRMFGVVFLLVIFFYIIIGLLAIGFIPEIAWLKVVACTLIVVATLILLPVSMGLEAAIYRFLSVSKEPKAEEPEVVVPAEAKAEAAPAEPKEEVIVPAKEEKPAPKKTAAKKPAAKKPAAKKEAPAPKKAEEKKTAAKKPASKKPAAKKPAAKKEK